MRRRRLLGLASSVVLAATGAAQAQADSAERERQLEAWWTRQRQKEDADRFWNGPRERRRDLTRDQIERWEYERWRRRYSRYPPYHHQPYW